MKDKNGKKIVSPLDSLRGHKRKPHRVQRIVRRCVLCGAKVHNQNPRTNTCDEICTRAKHAGRTRQQQIVFEQEKPPFEDERYEYCPGCGFFTSQCQCWDPVNQISA